MNAPAKWGIVSTIKAPSDEILAFVGYHLSLGAHRIYIYLDDVNEAAYEALKTHSKVRVKRADTDNWRGKKRPAKHQPRQTSNASHAAARTPEVDWLAHIDVDEFLCGAEIATALAALPEACMAARVRPVEALANESGTPSHFKACDHTSRDQRRAQTAEIYPEYGIYMNGGFLSHVAGKLFFRTGLAGLEVRIHNVFLSGEMNPGQEELAQIELAHCHAKRWEDWLATYQYRLAQGSYRAELKPATPHERGGLTMHEMFSNIETAGGETALRSFFDEVCADTPALRGRLKTHGHLRHITLDLATHRARHFPEHA